MVRDDDADRADALTPVRDEDAARAFFPADGVRDALDSTHRDGQARRIVVQDVADRALSIEVCRDADGRLVLGVADLEMLDSTASLRQLARRMAGETDTERLLELLCDAADRQTSGQGAGVLKAVGNDGELVAANGLLDEARGRRFTLSGSLAREVLRTRDVVAVENFSGSSRPLMQVVPDLKLGPMLLAPLIAHDVILGVIVVARAIGAAPFARREFARLRVIADYAAVALWKAELLEQAQAADRAKSRFLATVSHELRTPLTALAGYEELLADQVIGPLSDGQRDVLERMRSVTHHLASVIEELLTFSSLDEGRETLRPTDFLAADLLHAAAAVIEPLARQKHLAFHTVVPDVAIRMTSDVDKIRQVLVNIAGNAVKFTDAGAVWLELARVNGSVRFTIRDTGIGIAKRDLERLFRPFAQLDTGLTRRHGGTGLGLYISRRIAEMLGGYIEVESEPGKGSAFTLVLPADE
ncbi:MAG TPA: HAMP domain-containing sensor histidine kinase [Gemmatimonadaceae bacterium]|nr:HAMP domain-containing sensor histidine kinase [Gemmatimonadaceae bacterium]